MISKHWHVTELLESITFFHAPTNILNCLCFYILGKKVSALILDVKEGVPFFCQVE